MFLLKPLKMKMIMSMFCLLNPTDLKKKNTKT